MKTKQDFQECIESQEARILRIKVNKLLTEQERLDMIAECRNEINRINRLQLALAQRELRRTKIRQTIKLRGLETLLAIVLIVCSFSAKSQAYGSFEAQDKGFGINIGGMINRLDLRIGYEHPVSDNTIPSIGYASVGLQFLLSDDEDYSPVITPSIGYALYHAMDFSKYDVGEVINKAVPLVSIELGKNFMTGSMCPYGRYYAFVTYASKVFVGAGLRIFIKQ